jgi:hypothetical protein
MKIDLSFLFHFFLFRSQFFSQDEKRVGDSNTMTVLIAISKMRDYRGQAQPMFVSL